MYLLVFSLFIISWQNQKRDVGTNEHVTHISRQIFSLCDVTELLPVMSQVCLEPGWQNVEASMGEEWEVTRTLIILKAALSWTAGGGK